MISLNRSFAYQRITGQQRYATEIARELRDMGELDREFVPPKWASSSALRTWAWAQSIGARTPRNSALLTLTSRGPVAAPRHLVVIHDLFVLTNPEWFSLRYVRTHAPFLMAQIRTAAGLIAVSEATADELAAVAPSGVPVVVAPNAPSGIFTREGDVEHVLSRYSLERGRYLLSVGSKDPRKNLGGLMTAYNALPDEVRRGFPLVLVGGRHASFRDFALDVEHGCLFLEDVNDSELAALYRGARATVSMSHNEGFGLPLVEAAACGSPLVLSDIPVYRWVAGESALYADPTNNAAIRDALSKAIEEGVPPPTHDPGRFTWGKSAQAIVNLASEVLA